MLPVRAPCAVQNIKKRSLVKLYDQARPKSMFLTFRTCMIELASLWFSSFRVNLTDCLCGFLVDNFLHIYMHSRFTPQWVDCGSLYSLTSRSCSWRRQQQGIQQKYESRHPPPKRLESEATGETSDNHIFHRIDRDGSEVRVGTGTYYLLSRKFMLQESKLPRRPKLCQQDSISNCIFVRRWLMLNIVMFDVHSSEVTAWGSQLSLEKVSCPLGDMLAISLIKWHQYSRVNDQLVQRNDIHIYMYQCNFGTSWTSCRGQKAGLFSGTSLERWGHRNVVDLVICFNAVFRWRGSLLPVGTKWLHHTLWLLSGWYQHKNKNNIPFYWYNFHFDTIYDGSLDDLDNFHPKGVEYRCFLPHFPEKTSQAQKLQKVSVSISEVRLITIVGKSLKELNRVKSHVMDLSSHSRL